MRCQAVGGGSGPAVCNAALVKRRCESVEEAHRVAYPLAYSSFSRYYAHNRKPSVAGGKMLSRTSVAFCLFVVGISVIIIGRAQRNPSGNATLFEGARLIVGDGSAAIESAAFVVENGRFSSVGRKGQIQAPPNATRIDLIGKTVMSAMVDVH